MKVICKLKNKQVIVNYLFVEQPNIPETPAYGVYISCLICIARVCDSYKQFKLHQDNLFLKLYHRGCFKYHKQITLHRNSFVVN